MRRIPSFALIYGFILIGCGRAVPSPELQSARDVVQRARASEAARLEPDELRSAVRLLQKAESAPSGSDVEADLAYLAERRAMMAMANAREEATRRALAAEEARYQQELEAAAIRRGGPQAVGEALEEVQRELAEIRRQLQERGDALDEQTRQLQEREELLRRRERELLAARREARQAQERADEAIAALQEFADVREGQGETIITIPGEILFVYDEAELRPLARRRLGQVASALKNQPGEYEIVVEGHTDSRGSDEYNMELSQRRAESVERFLVEQGVQDDRIRAVGRGEQEPIASNDSPENRANNRRVEIILRRDTAEARRDEQARVDPSTD